MNWFAFLCSWGADRQARNPRGNNLYTQVSTTLGTSIISTVPATNSFHLVLFSYFIVTCLFIGWETPKEDRNCCEHCLYFLEEEICIHCPSLTWSQKLLACALLTGGFEERKSSIFYHDETQTYALIYSSLILALGYIVGMGSFFKFTELVHGNPIPFVTQYTFGVVLSMFSSWYDGLIDYFMHSKYRILSPFLCSLVGWCMISNPHSHV